MNNEETRLKKKGAKKQDPVLFKLAKYTAIGLEFPSTIVGGMLLGYLLDLYFRTSPWLAIAVTLLAFVGAVMRLVQWVKRFSGEDR